ncbi:MAG: pectate lyase [Gammaproteobacteria bacterium]
MLSRVFIIIAALSVAACQAIVVDTAVVSKPLAFPGAEGFGRHAQGGRGGKVLRVTNLNDAGPGSLRDAVEKPFPRTILFDVSGYIDLERELKVEHGYLTIAGQSAPGAGITLRRHALVILADHVIVRYLRARTGASARVETDSISIMLGHNIIVDHCSASFATDETLSISPSRKSAMRGIDKVTVQWSIISESLNNSVHGKGEHGYGSLLRGSDGARYTLHRNLWAHHQARMPRPGNYIDLSGDPVGPLIDIRNNWFYNWGGQHSGYNADTQSRSRYSFVGNRYIAGPDSKGNIAFAESNPHARLYFAHNWMNGQLVNNVGTALVVPHEDVLVETEFALDYEMLPADQSEMDRVLTHGGASRYRDAIDDRVVDSVRQRSGRLIDSVSDTPGWPALPTTVAPLDTDGDGMPDTWERSMGLDPADARDGSRDADGDGYTNLEVFLNSLATVAHYKR